MTHAHKLGRARLLATVVRGLLVLIGLGPFLPGLFGDLPVLGAVGHALDGWFAFQCHREAARSFGVLGHLLPVCSRCFGIYFGLGLGALVLRPRLGATALRLWVGFAVVVMLLDVATEALGMRREWAPLRVVTGLLLSYPVGIALVLAVRGDVPVQPHDDAAADAAPTRRRE